MTIKPTDLPSSDHKSTRLRSSRQFQSAGHVLGVGLLCFALWFAVDARQLLQSASSSPLGVRRSVAMSLLRPIARVSEFFSIDRIENGANRALGRGITTPGESGLPSTSSDLGTSTNSNSSSSTSKTGHPTTRKTPVVAPGPILEPSATHPVTILAIGDSIGEDLGDGLEDALGSNTSVRLIQAAEGNTGLANTAYYNWPANLALELKRYHPSIVVALFGGNDWQSFAVTRTRNAVLATPYWRAQYAARVASMMSEVTTAGAQMVWVGLPLMAPSAPFPQSMAATLNLIYADEAKQHEGVSFFSSMHLFANAAGKYAEYLPANGSLVAVRDADGVHLALPGGSDRLADATVALINQLFKIHL